MTAPAAGGEEETLLLPAVAEVARKALPTAAGADGLAHCLEPALTANRAAIRATLAGLVLLRLVEAYRKAPDAGSGQVDPAVARFNAQAIAEDVIAEPGFFSKLARWVAVNVCFWLWEGDTLDSVDGESVGALVRVYAESSAQVLADMLSPPQKPVESLKDILGIGRNAEGPILPGELPQGMMPMLSAIEVQSLREALYKNAFRAVEGSVWPTAPLGRVASRHFAQMRPAAADDPCPLPAEQVAAWARTMWRQQRDLSDRDADALDALCAIYMAQARNPNDAAVAELDQLLALRGLKPKRGGAGRRGGYEPEQREDMLKALAHLQNIWITIAQVESGREGARGRQAKDAGTKTLQSRLFVITDRTGELRQDGSVDVERFVFRPGRAFAACMFGEGMFGEGRQTALLFQKALQYDPYRRRWEKRLTRYLCWQWRALAADAGAGQSCAVQALLDSVGEPVDTRYPGKTRARLEKALDRLVVDKVLAAWRYAAAPPDGRHHRWVEEWLQAEILVEAPQPVRDYYRRLGGEGGGEESLIAGLRRRRRALGMTQVALAKALGIRQGHLSKIECGRMRPSDRVRRAIEEWLGSDC